MVRKPTDEAWTDLGAIRDQLNRLWSKGELLRATIDDGAQWFPLRVRPWRCPISADYHQNLEAVRTWVLALEDEPRIEVSYEAVRHRVLGDNQRPVGAVVPTLAVGLALIGKTGEAARFAALRQQALATLPAVDAWLQRYPLKALELADDWHRLIAVVMWIRAHPRPDIYVRQMPLVGIDTKWVEVHRGVITQWCDLVLEPGTYDETARGVAQFERRYGFRRKPVLVRLRPLDPVIELVPGGGPAELTLTGRAFARLRAHPAFPGITRVIYTENEINFLTLPPVAGAIAVFGSGFGAEGVATASWLREVTCWYWGDIDTNGFVILDQFRAHLPELRSLMMDQATLEAHRDQWVTESVPQTRPLPRLMAAEAEVYHGLILATNDIQVRLEQERIAYPWIEERLREV